MAQAKSQAASESAKEPAETTAEGQHKCVFCAQLFPSKPDLQTHFRLHANGVIDIKGQLKSQVRAAQRPSKTTTSPHTTARTTTTITTSITTTTITTAATTTTTASTTTATATSTTTSTTTAATPTGKNTAACDVCGESFHTVSLAISHKFRKHPDSLVKHYCPHCGMMFPIKLSRDKHLLTHSGPPPKQLFPCVPCGVTFYNQRAKKFHMDSAHKGATRMVNPIRTPAPSMKIVVNNAGEPLSVYYCHLCGCEYQVKYNLQKHLASKHSQAERDALPKELVQCNLCSAVFYSKWAYESHSHHHRDGDLFATNEQMRQQVVQRIDQDFDHRRVPTPVERYLSASAITSNRSATWKNIQAARRAQATTSSLQAISTSSSGSTSLQFIDSTSGYSVSPSSSSSSSQLLTSSSQPHEANHRERKVKEEREDQDESQNSSSSDKHIQIKKEIKQEVEEQQAEGDKNVTFITHSKGREIHIPLQALKEEAQEEDRERGGSGGGGGGGGAREDFLPWAMDDKRRRRMMDESEEEDEGEVMRSLGNVNPDTILSRGVMRGVKEEEEEGKTNEKACRTALVLVEEEATKKRDEESENKEDVGKKKGRKKRKEEGGDDEDKGGERKKTKTVEVKEEVQDKEEAGKTRRKKRKAEDAEELEGTDS